MAEPAVIEERAGRRSLNHFAAWTLNDEYWRLSESEQGALRARWIKGLSDAATAVHHYRTFPLETHAQILTWTAIDATDPAEPQRFFNRISEATRPFHRYLRLVDVLWGFTRKSEYSRARSRGAIDPFDVRTRPYMVVYPFAKTADWYALDPERRQSMMNEHIRIGKQYGEVTQLLLYSTGLQDQEFVVVYETADLPMFSQLVAELRGTEARSFTRIDTPVHTAVHSPVDDPDRLWP